MSLLLTGFLQNCSKCFHVRKHRHKTPISYDYSKAQIQPILFKKMLMSQMGRYQQVIQQCCGGGMISMAHVDYMYIYIVGSFVE